MKAQNWLIVTGTIVTAIASINLLSRPSKGGRAALANPPAQEEGVRSLQPASDPSDLSSGRSPVNADAEKQEARVTLVVVDARGGSPLANLSLFVWHNAEISTSEGKAVPSGSRLPRTDHEGNIDIRVPASTGIDLEVGTAQDSKTLLSIAPIIPGGNERILVRLHA